MTIRSLFFSGLILLFCSISNTGEFNSIQEFDAARSKLLAPTTPSIYPTNDDFTATHRYTRRYLRQINRAFSIEGHSCPTDIKFFKAPNLSDQFGFIKEILINKVVKCSFVYFINDEQKHIIEKVICGRFDRQPIELIERNLIPDNLNFREAIPLVKSTARVTCSGSKGG